MYLLVLREFSKDKQRELLERSDDVMAFDYKKEYKEFYLPSEETASHHGPAHELCDSAGEG